MILLVTVMHPIKDPYVQAALQAPPSPDYVSGPEHPPLHVYVPEFVLESVYPEFIPAEDDILPAEEQPLPAAASPITKSPGYIDEIDPDEDPKDDPEEDPADYPADGGYEGDDEDELMAIPTPPPSPLSLLSSPLPSILLPLPVSPLLLSLPLPTSPTYLLG
nr:hypothetical protein [Tanacetum cinerariifolium]